MSTYKMPNKKQLTGRKVYIQYWKSVEISSNKSVVSIQHIFLAWFEVCSRHQNMKCVFAINFNFLLDSMIGSPLGMCMYSLRQKRPSGNYAYQCNQRIFLRNP